MFLPFVKSKKILKNDVTVSIDLNSERLELLKKARDLVKDSEIVDFVCADVNC